MSIMYIKYCILYNCKAGSSKVNFLDRFFRNLGLQAHFYPHNPWQNEQNAESESIDPLASEVGIL